MKSFDLVTLCDLVIVFAETKSVTKSRLHCTRNLAKSYFSPDLLSFTLFFESCTNYLIQIPCNVKKSRLIYRNVEYVSCMSHEFCVFILKRAKSKNGNISTLCDKTDINSVSKQKWQKFIQKIYWWKVLKTILSFYLYSTWLCVSWKLQRILEK